VIQAIVITGGLRQGFRAHIDKFGPVENVALMSPAGCYRRPLRRSMIESRLDESTYGNEFAVGLVGNVSDGYAVYGPYRSFGEAADDLDGMESWIVTGTMPGYGEF
jgi:hypothetical protein